ncbi:hypothetical protein HHI36_012067 [Cryptolaemus montrouzieri]|uniref:EGF-like domain-containing protein n=1 Tax=Cryptolaemus montrouzieri TaxID=559131 RepID=A0ABD2NDE0_9CUCU
MIVNERIQSVHVLKDLMFLACEPMRWGKDCKFECLCQHGSCNPRTGRCDCPSGWFGTRCELLCLEGFYGKHCINRCNCGERELCSPETGECIQKSTHRQEHQSTRAIHYSNENIYNITHFDKHRSTPSLTKYHTFDMELTSRKPQYTHKIKYMPTITNEDRERTINIRHKTLQPKVWRNSTKFDGKISKHQTTKGMEESLESTTEISAEIDRNLDSVPIINEYGSFEKKNITEINVATNDNLSKSSNQGASNESDENFPSFIEEKIFTTSSRKLNITQNKIKDKNLVSHENHSANVSVENDSESHKPLNKRKGKNNKGSMNMSVENDRELSKLLVNNSRIHSTSNQNKKKAQDNSKENNSREHTSLNKYPSTLDRKVSKKTTTQKSGNSNTGVLKNKTTKTTTDATEKKITIEHINEVNTNVPFTIENDGHVTSTSTSRGELFANIPPILKTTSPVPKSNRRDDTVEEDQLQNLDSSNMLTSRETSTTSAILTTITSVTVGKNGIFTLTDQITSTRTFDDAARNVLSTPESSIRTTKISLDSRRTKEENYLSDEASEEFEFSSSESTTALATHMSIAALISFILKRRKRESKLKSEHHQNVPGGPSVSVYTHSIFHTPLPDPPTFENPVFTRPTENSVDPRSFQTHVVCSLNLPCHHGPTEKEYTYDHPPSTGSYRAASIPEPPDINEMVTTEPVYDEIPSNRRTTTTASPPPSYKSSCIYVNTCGKTRF